MCISQREGNLEEKRSTVLEKNHQKSPFKSYCQMRLLGWFSIHCCWRRSPLAFPYSFPMSRSGRVFSWFTPPQVVFALHPLLLRRPQKRKLDNLILRDALAHMNRILKYFYKSPKFHLRTSKLHLLKSLKPSLAPLEIKVRIFAGTAEVGVVLYFFPLFWRMVLAELAAASATVAKSTTMRLVRRPRGAAGGSRSPTKTTTWRTRLSTEFYYQRRKDRRPSRSAAEAASSPSLLTSRTCP